MNFDRFINILMSYYSTHPSLPNLMFIHTPKTAGTSVENWFWKVYGKQNVVVHKHAPIHYSILSELKMYKFSIIRNPFSRAVSWYQQGLSLILLDESIKRFNIEGLTQEAWNKGFDYFIQTFFEKKGVNPGSDISISPSYTQYYYLTINDTIAVDKILRFENLSYEFKQIEEIVGSNYGLEKLKIGPSDNLRDWKKVYTPTSKRLIEHIYKKDLDYFNYEF